MDEKYYSEFFHQALMKIKAERAPRAQNTDSTNLGWAEVEQQRFFDFGGMDFVKCQQVINAAKNTSFSLMEFILLDLAEEKETPLKRIDRGSVEGFGSPITFCIKDTENGILYLFKDVEECPFWKKTDEQELREYWEKHQCNSCKYIYFMYDLAFMQIINHNNDLDDAGRGHNAYSFKWFFSNYYGEKEWLTFEKELKKYISQVNNYIGYTIMRSLSPWALVNFKKITERKLMSHKYEEILNIRSKDKKEKEYAIEKTELDKIKTQFMHGDLFRAMIGTCDYSESLITAEWLLDTMKKAEAVDLTVIGTGYFKAVEQLLYTLIVMHRDDNPKRRIRKDFSFKDIKSKDVYLNEYNIKNKIIDTTLGSMATFVKDNLDILRDDLKPETREFVREVIFDYADLRNGYFHKDNIHDLKTVEQIRDASYNMFLLLLGSKDLKDKRKIEELGIIPDDRTDYDKLCEYIDYHQGNIFIFNTEEGNEYAYFAAPDHRKELTNAGTVKYSGAYFKKIGTVGPSICVTDDHCPDIISLGKLLGDDQQNKVNLSPTIVKRIYEKGKYVGPILSEEDLEY